MGFIEDILTWITAALTPYRDIPQSTLFVVGLSIAVTVMTSATNRLLTNVDRMRSTMREISAWRRQMDKARKTNDKQLLAKLQKKQQAMMQLQSKSSFEQMKVSFLFMFPLLALWYVLGGFFGNTIVAFSPFQIPFLTERLTFASWYILCSFSVSLPLMRLLGLSFRAEEG